MSKIITLTILCIMNLYMNVSAQYFIIKAGKLFD